MDKLKLKIFVYEFDLPGRKWIEKYAFSNYVQQTLQFLLKYFAKMDASIIKTFAQPISPKESVKKVNSPSLFIVCASDKTVPVPAVKTIYGNAPCYKRLWITDGARHYGSLFHDPEEYAKRTNEFIEKILSGDHKKEIQEEVVTKLTPEEIEKKMIEESKIVGLYS